MKLLFSVFLLVTCPYLVLGQSPAQKKPVPSHPNMPASEEVQTERIGTPGQAPAVPVDPAAAAGHLGPQQVKDLMHKVWLAQFRLNDLLAQVHSEKWKMPAAARQSFDQSMDGLRKALAGEEEWRSQFEDRSDSSYLGFQTYVAISAVLPRVDGVARSVSQYENPSFGGQYSQAANQLFDLQQLMEPHLSYLLKNQDNVQLTAQTNLASCENELNYAEHNKQGQAIPMRNIAPEFKGRKRNAHPPSPAGEAKPAETKGAATGKPAANPPNKADKKQ